VAANSSAFLAGAALFGATMFVPLFVQGALGGSATNAGLVLAPLMLALIAGSVGSGQVITRTGRYRWALLSGPLLLLAGYAILSGLDAGSGRGVTTAAMVALGLGLGLILQNLTLVIQNTVPSRHLGAGTAAGQFFRSMGGTLGVAVMGAMLASGLPAGAQAGRALDTGTGAARAELADAIHPVFVIGIPLSLLLLAALSRIPEAPLRRAVRGDSSGVIGSVPT
jgi:MFS family permease